MNEWAELKEEKQKTKYLLWYRILNVVCLLSILLIPIMLFKLAFGVFSLSFNEASTSDNLQAFSRVMDTDGGKYLVSGTILYFSAIMTAIGSTIYIVVRLWGYDISIVKRKLWTLPE
ncbi:hypothetical protein [Paenibacillus sp. MMO-177]|uniref:hypothetical protein n=1 Tax=Paenibacillus sp. MMO-177 TaxID=3081289 RepID=UPI0030158D85